MRAMVSKAHMEFGVVAEENAAAAIARGREVKRNNAIVALVTGGSLALLLAAVFSFKLVGFLFGLGAGLVYANGFEYCFHRFLLHLPNSFLGEEHDLHHSTWGTPDEMRYANFAKTPWAVAVLFAINAVPVAAIEWVFRAGLGPGMLVAFSLYFIAFEEIHWRVHLGVPQNRPGRKERAPLPSWLESARRHHLSHHAHAEERFNVFLPLFDWLLGSKKG